MDGECKTISGDSGFSGCAVWQGKGGVSIDCREEETEVWLTLGDELLVESFKGLVEICFVVVDTTRLWFSISTPQVCLTS